MVGLIGGCLPIEPLALAQEILKALAVIQESSKLIAPETIQESISESSTVTIT